MRIAVREAASIVLAVALMAPFAQPALADEQWCSTDPVFLVAGVQFRASAGFTADRATVQQVTYELSVPSNVEVSVYADNANTPVPAYATVTYDGAPWESGPIPVTLRVTVVTSSGFAVAITVYGAGIQQPQSFTGTAGETASIPLELALP